MVPLLLLLGVVIENDTAQINKEAHHSCCESLFGVLLTYTMQWDIMEANNSDAKNEESDALTYGFVTFIRIHWNIERFG